MRRLERVCVFCGSSMGLRPEYASTAAELGRLLASEKITLVYGGARVGLMGTLADAALKAAGEVIGVMPLAMVEKEKAHTGLSKLHIVGSMHERKAMMAELADAFILLPGGFGSWEEFCEVVTWAQLGMHAKPLGILNVAGYYDALLALSAHAVAEGFVKAKHRDMIAVEETPELLLAALRAARVDYEEKWVTEREV